MPLALLAASALVWNASQATFSDTTESPNNNWTTGTVAITNDHEGSAVFTQTALAPDTVADTLTVPAGGPLDPAGATSGGSKCVLVTYQGTSAATVRLYATVTGTLNDDMLFTVDTGTGATGEDCTGYTRSADLYGASPNSTYKIADLPTDYATAGVADSGAHWTNATQNATKWYRLSWLLPKSTADSVEGQSVTAAFTWEAQNN